MIIKCSNCNKTFEVESVEQHNSSDAKGVLVNKEEHHIICPACNCGCCLIET